MEKRNKIKQEVRCYQCKEKIEGYAYPILFKKRKDGFAPTVFICEQCKEKLQAGKIQLRNE